MSKRLANVEERNHNGKSLIMMVLLCGLKIAVKKDQLDSINFSYSQVTLLALY